MNHFPYAYEPLKKVEGGYANHPDDPGGETYAGIARNYFPTWSGWNYLDRIAGKKTNQKFPALADQVKEFYYTEKWLRYGFDKLDNPDVAAAVLDTVVQHGRGPYLIQEALVRNGKPVTVDGRIGSATLSYLNVTPAKAFLAALHDVRADYYRGLVAENPKLATFLPGWLKRIDKWKGAATGGVFAFIAAAALGAYYFLRRGRK